MKTFENQIESRGFWAAVVIPPGLYWSLVSAFTVSSPDQGSLDWMLVLLVLANGLPLAALCWTLLSVCAFSLAPGKLIIHRVIRDREWPLTADCSAVRKGSRVVELLVSGRRLVLRPADPDDFLLEVDRAKCV